MFAPVPPSSKPVPVSTPVPPLPREEELDLRAVVGPNADHFIRCWRPVLTGRSTDIGFSRIAFFLPFIWLVYRKMYLVAMKLFGVLLGIAVVETVVCYFLFGVEQPHPLLVTIDGIVFASICGGYANRWYLKHVQRIIADTRGEKWKGIEFREALALRGGTDIWSASVFGILWVLVIGIELGAGRF